MKVLELFAGTRSIGKAFEARGHEVFSVEWDKSFENINLYADIMTVTAEEILQKFGKPDVIWASPDCTTFSIAAISHHRRKNPETGNLDPVSDYAKFCDSLDQHVLRLILALSPKLWFIENPRGGMRKMTWMQGLPRYTVTYCQYGDTRMKPTDIWTNHPDPRFKPMCKNGDGCHISAPRGAKTGTQGLKGSRERSVIPDALCEHIVKICERECMDRRKYMNIKLDAGAKMPVRAHDTDAGYDLFACESKVVPAGGSVIFDTGVHVELPVGSVGMVKSKSGLNVKHGITSEGVIDAGYTGSIRVKLYNHSDKAYPVYAGDKISQLVILPILTPDLELVDELEATDRGTGGFGSTGR